VIDVGAISRRFSSGSRTFELDVPALQLQPGQLVYVIGPNGSGKSLYLRTVARDPVEGTSRFTPSVREAKQDVAPLLVRQAPDDNLAPSLTAIENYAVWTRPGSLSEALFPIGRAREAAAELAHLFPSVASAWNQPVSTLSGGQKQALVLFCRFQSNPRLLLLDEVTAAVDEVAVPPMLDFLKSRIQSSAAACLIVSHDFDQVSEYADRVLVMSRGKIVQDLSMQRAGGSLAPSELRATIASVWLP
jgi:putative ABC transport system ATP-binding protein